MVQKNFDYVIIIRKKLIEERGYPGEVVNKCIVDYLENQYLCD